MIIPSPQWMLLAGILLSPFVLKHSKFQGHFKLWGTKLLQLSVILLGSSLNFNQVLKQGADGVLLTFISIALIFILGYTGMKFLKIDFKQGLLITMGTAICGGSAIAALAPVIAADSVAITVSIGIVFLLNGLSVFIFPVIGDFLHLSQEQFGLWAALAIHDTSSVVAASSLFGARALEVATTIKLTRALWIIPITLFFSFKTHKGSSASLSIPWFILGFLLFSLAFTFWEALTPLKTSTLLMAKWGFSLTLFFIGLNFNFSKIKQVGKKSFIFGIGLWIMVVIGSLLFVNQAQHL